MLPSLVEIELTNLSKYGGVVVLSCSDEKVNLNMSD